MRLIGILDQVDEFGQGASVSGATGIVLDEVAQTGLGNELVDENDDANGADETTQEGTTQHTVKKAESEKASKQDDGTGNSSDHAGDLSITGNIVVPMLARTDVLAHYLTSQEGTCSLGANNKLRDCAKDGIDEWVEDKSIETIYRWEMGQI